MATFSIALSGLDRRQLGAGHHLEQYRQREHHRLQELGRRVRRRVRLGRGQSQQLDRRRGRAARRRPPSSSPRAISPPPSGALDLAISGNGFFTLNSPNGNVYTRNGQFSEDANGNVVSATGQFLQVYPPLANGGFNTGALQNLNLQHRAERAGGDHRRAT